jgi:hypothetical protein
MPLSGNLPYLKQVLAGKGRFRGVKIGLGKGKKRNVSVQKSYSALHVTIELTALN